MKRTLKKGLAAGLAMILTAGLLTACGSADVSSETEEPSSAVSTAETVSDESSAEEASENDMSAYFHSKDPYTIKIMMFGTATTEAAEEISAALSEITEEKLNADVELTMVNMGTYSEQLNMMLYSGDEFDLFCPFGGVSEMVYSGQIRPLDDLLDAYAPNIKNLVKDVYWNSTTYDGEIYGVPINTEKAYQLGFAMRKDICDELGIDYENMSTLDEVHDVLVQVKEAYPDMYPIVSDQGNMFASATYIGQDEAGDSYHLTVAEDPYAEHPEIVSFFETDLFKERTTMLYQWAQEGLIMPDASTNTEMAQSLVAAGKAFGYFQHMKPGWEADQTQNVGTEIVSIRYAEPVLTADSVSWYVPTSSGDPERAVAMLDLMYSDPDVSNLVVNGIEGEHYVVIDQENGVAAYPEGVDATTVTYTRMNWAWPNPQIAYLWEGQDLDIWDQYTEFNDSARVTTSNGFNFNSNNVLNEITACTNVYNKYVPALLCGSLDPETTIPQLNAEMEQAGIDTIISEKQKQLDEWLSQQ